MDITGKPTEMASLDHGNSEFELITRKSLHETELSPLYICDSCITWSICGPPGNESRCCPWCLGWLIGTYSSC